MVVTPFLMTEKLELYLKLVLCRNISNKDQQEKNQCTTAKSKPSLVLNLFFFVGQFFFITD